MTKGKVFVVSGPSGVGKGTICTKLMERYPDLAATTVSATTRKPRVGEVDGVHYFFITPEKFEELYQAGAFLESVSKFNNRYGTLMSEIERIQGEGKNVILEIEMNGGKNVKKRIPDSVLIFILPPTLETLTGRLVGRDSESEEQLKIRQSQVQSELQQAIGYEYFVVNDDLDCAIDKVKSIIVAEDLKADMQEDHLKELLGGKY